jgi:hypothetical protein
VIEGTTLIGTLRENVSKGGKFTSMALAGKWMMDTVGHDSPLTQFLKMISSPSTAKAMSLSGKAEKGWGILMDGLRAKSAAKVKEAAQLITGATAAPPPKPPRTVKPPPRVKPDIPKPPRPSKPPKTPPIRSSRRQQVVSVTGSPRVRFTAAQTSAKTELARSRQRWNAAVDRGDDPVAATVKRIKATKDPKKLESIRKMVEGLGTKIGPDDWKEMAGVLGPASKPKRSASAKPPKTPAKPKRSASKPKPPAAPRRRRSPAKPPKSQPAMRAAAEAAVEQAIVEAVKMHARGTATSGKKRVRFDFTLTKKR